MEEETKTPEQILMERAAEEREQQILQFKNIDSEAFTHSFRGVSTTVQVGAVYAGTRPAVEHLATHLARKILARATKERLSKLPVQQQNAHLWEDNQVEALTQKMISPVGGVQEASQGVVEAPQEDEITKKDVLAELTKLGLKPDPNLSRDELLQELIKAKAK